MSTERTEEGAAVIPLGREGPAPVISVVIPVYNEYDGLEACYEAVTRTLNEYGRPWEIVFIDDCSADGSLDKLLTFAARDPRIKVIEHTRNLGAVKAILSGLRLSRGEVVIPFDPDLQFAPECLPQLADKVLSGYDFVGGIRVNRNDRWTKKLSSALSSRIINRMMGIRQKDFGSIKAYNRRMVDDILSMPQDFMSVQGAAYSLSRNFTEIPIRHQPREVGASKWTSLMRLNYFLDVYTSYAKYPFSGLLLGGFGLALVGLAAFAGVGLHALLSGGPLDVATGVWLVLTMLWFLAGNLFMAIAFVGQFVLRTFRRKYQLNDTVWVRVHQPRPAPAEVSHGA